MLLLTIGSQKRIPPVDEKYYDKSEKGQYMYKKI